MIGRMTGAGGAVLVAAGAQIVIVTVQTFVTATTKITFETRITADTYRKSLRRRAFKFKFLVGKFFIFFFWHRYTAKDACSVWGGHGMCSQSHINDGIYFFRFTTIERSRNCTARSNRNGENIFFFFSELNIEFTIYVYFWCAELGVYILLYFTAQQHTHKIDECV